VARCLAGVVVLAATGCGHPEVGARPPAPETALRDGTRQPLRASTLEHLAVLATGTLPAVPLLETVPSGTAVDDPAVAEYVDALLADPRFARAIAPAVLLPFWDLADEAFIKTYTLKAEPGPRGDPVYHLRKPCAPAQAVRVRPWWDFAREVLVCPDSYQPTHDAYDASSGLRCGGYALEPSDSDFCGCGPNLVHCVRSEAHRREMLESLKAEVFGTIADNAANGAHLEDVFTANATVRDANAEFVYRSWQIDAGTKARLDDLASWPTPNEPTPRPEAVPEQHAGILTTPHLVLMADTPRARLRNYFNILWCQGTASKGVDAGTILSLGVTNLRNGEGWRELAAKPVCTNCHARLDYGMQFFDGYPNIYYRESYLPPSHASIMPGRGTLYGADIHDARGEEELSPAGFARLAVAQPEFAACMVERVVGHVFGEEATPAVKDAMLRQFGADHSLRGLMRVALLAYAQGDDGPGAPDTFAEARPVLPSEGASLAVSGPLRADIARNCAGCHAGESGSPNLGGDALPPPLVAKMLEEVASGEMPKTFLGMDPGARRGLALDLIGTLWSDEPRRRDAARTYTDESRPFAAHDGAAAAEIIRVRSGAARTMGAVPFPGDPASEHRAMRDARLSGSFVVAAAAQALADCKASSPRDLVACIRRSVAARDLVNAPLE
jgi:hypothetical protein